MWTTWRAVGIRERDRCKHNENGGKGNKLQGEAILIHIQIEEEMICADKNSG